MVIMRRVNRIMGYVATSFMIVLMLLTVLDVFLRYFFDSPISGATEISRLLMVIIVFPALGWAAIDRAHVKVDLIVNRFSTRIQAFIEAITLTIALITYGFITWWSFQESAVVNRQTSLLRIPFEPFYWLMSVGLFIFCLAILVLIIEDIIKVVKK